jgi:hypothetical protein
MDRTVDPTAAEQAAVGGVDDRVDVQGRDVGLQDGDPVPDLRAHRHGVHMTL